MFRTLILIRHLVIVASFRGRSLFFACVCFSVHLLDYTKFMNGFW